MDDATAEAIVTLAESNVRIAAAQTEISVMTRQAQADRSAERITAARTLTAEGTRLRDRIAKTVGAAATVGEAMLLVSDVAAALARFVTPAEKKALLVELVAGESDAYRRGATVAEWLLVDFECVGTNVFEAPCIIKLWTLLQLPAVVLNCVPQPVDKESLGAWLLRAVPHRWLIVFRATCKPALRESAPLFFWQHVGQLLLLSTPLDIALVAFRTLLGDLTGDSFPVLMQTYSVVQFTKGRVSTVTGADCDTLGLATALVSVARIGATPLPVLAIIDTGANRSLISETLARQCGSAASSSWAETVTVADGSRTAPLRPVLALVEGVMLEFLVVPDATGIELLLGVPALRQLGGAVISIPPVDGGGVDVRLPGGGGGGGRLPAATVSDVNTLTPALADADAVVDTPAPALAADADAVVSVVLFTSASDNELLDELVLQLHVVDESDRVHDVEVMLAGSHLLTPGGRLAGAAVEAAVEALEALDAELAGTAPTARAFFLTAADSRNTNVDALPLAPSTPTASPASPPMTTEFKYKSAFEVFEEKIAAHSLLNQQQKDRIVAHAKSVGFKGTSKFAPPEHGLPPLKDVVHRIVLRRGASLRGVRAGYRAHSSVKAGALRAQLHAWIAAGFVERTQPNSGFALSAPVLVQKANGSWRVAVDFRALNKQSESDPFPPPPMQKVLQLAAGGAYTTIIDGAYLFNQIALAPESRPLTATLFGPGQVYQFTRAPFGLNSILGTAQRYMSQTFDVEDQRLAYVDDVIHSHVDDETEIAVDEFLALITLCADTNFIANFDKLIVIEPRVPIFGYTVSRGQITPQHSRCSAIVDWPEPQNNAELRQLLQTAQYYAAFIPGWTEMTVPLWTAIRRSQPLVWTATTRAYLQRLRDGFAHAAVATRFDPLREAVVTTDSCGHAISATVCQRDDAGILRFVATAGRRLLAHEQVYPIDVKEALAIGFALRRFDEYVDSVDWTWVTDCASLGNLERAPIYTRHVAVQRIMLQLQAHIGRLTIRVVKSKENLFCDALGRFHLRDPTATAFSIVGSSLDQPAPGVMVLMLRSGKAYGRTPARPLVGLDVGFASPPSSPDVAAEPDSPVSSPASDSDSEPEPEPEAAQPAALAPVLGEPLTPSLDKISDGTAMPADGKAMADDGAADEDAVLEEPPTPTAAPPTAFDVDAMMTPGRAPLGFDVDEAQAEWARAQRADRLGRDLRRFAAGETAPPATRALLPSIDSTGRVFVRVDGQIRLFVPAALVPDVLGALHNGSAGGHRSAEQMVLRLREHYYWPQMLQSAQQFRAACGVCARMAPARAPTNLGTPDAALKLRRLHVDLLPMPPSTDGMHCIVLMRDAATGHTALRTLPNRRWETIRPAIEEDWLLQHGPPAVLVPDGAVELKGKGMQTLAKQYGFKLMPTAPYNSQQNGVAESAVKMIKRAIMSMLGDRPVGDWPSVVQVAAWQYNTAISAPRGATPYALMRGMEAPNALLRKSGIKTATPGETQAMLETKMQQSLADAALQRNKRHQLDLAATARRGEAFVPSVGQIVWLENPAAPTAIEAKHHKRDGPFQVVSLDPTGKHLCQVKQWNTQTLVKGAVAFRRLTPFLAPLEPVVTGKLEESDPAAPIHKPPQFFNQRQRAAHARDRKRQARVGLAQARILCTRFDAVYGPLLILQTLEGLGVEVPLTSDWQHQFREFRDRAVRGWNRAPA
jgi:hypothetical protein